MLLALETRASPSNDAVGGWYTHHCDVGIGGYTGSVETVEKESILSQTDVAASVLTEGLFADRVVLERDKSVAPRTGPEMVEYGVVGDDILGGEPETIDAGGLVSAMEGLRTTSSGSVDAVQPKRRGTM